MSLWTGGKIKGEEEKKTPGQQPAQALALLEIPQETESAELPVEMIAPDCDADFACAVSEPMKLWPHDSETDPTRDVGYQPRPVTAETVFGSVSAVPASRRFFRWLLVPGLCTAMIAVVCVIYYHSAKPPARPAFLPIAMADGVNALRSSAPEELPGQVPAGTVSEALSPEFTGTDAAGDSGGTPLSVIDPDARDPGQVDVPAASELPATAEKPTANAAGDAGGRREDEPPAGEPVSAPVTETSSVIVPADDEVVGTASGAPVVEISHRRPVSDHAAALARAYADYFAGDNGAAEAGYRKVLAALPGNRDALLGLAAIARSRGDLPGARKRYLAVLKHHPKDAVAGVALIHLDGDLDPLRRESILKLLIQDNPELPFLYFSLGGHYAAQSRWHEAQQSFFEAYRLDAANPDAAFNLAVCLDHLGQAASALFYYRAALELAEASRAGFDTSTILARITVLSGAVAAGD